jgi:glycosyltransferase involved in cell wall biosynthesis
MKRAFIKTIGTIPQVKNYLHQKQAMQQKLLEQKSIIKALKAENQQTSHDLKMIRGQIPNSVTVQWPVFEKDIIKAYSGRQIAATRKPKLPPYKINWVVPPMDAVSGGHTDIFRTISYLEAQGHTCRVYFYDALERYSLNKLRKTMLDSYPAVKAELYYNVDKMADCDAIFATNWFTAYPVLNYSGVAKKYYYVQDFEPYFDPKGSYSMLAENTYNFGFHGLTLSKWLSKKLATEYSMECDSFELGVDGKDYHVTNNSKRPNILFYARPVTPRRGFEMGVLALKEFHEMHPEYEIHMLGWDLSMFKLPFPFVNHGVLSPSKLNELYNTCAAGLVISFTNMSLLPLEMLAAGCMPVINDETHTRLVKYADFVTYAQPNPVDLANALSLAVTKTVKAPKSVLEDNSWDKSNAYIEEILIRHLANEKQLKEPTK